MAKSKTQNPAKPVTQVVGDSQTGMTLTVQQARVRVIKGPDKGLVQQIPPHGLLVGKRSSCDLVLTDKSVSAVHCRFIPTELGFRIQDLGSGNGTWLHTICVRDAHVNRKENVVVGRTTLRLEIVGGYKEYPLSNDSFLGSMIGRSVAMRQVFALLERAAASDSTLLLEGESGTGKELAAEAVHGLSSRAKGPLVVVDCSSIQPTLLESHLFGHVKGSYTGATSDHFGAFEAAQGGTVFLDEIGELNPELQPHLLRVIERRQVRRIGETVYRPVDVRLIAATNRNLKSETESGRFREDLFYRLSVLRVHMPPLRDRLEDLPLLASAMINQLSEDTAAGDILSDEVLSLLNHHDWPGNVRELRNVIERLLVFPEWSEQTLDTDLRKRKVPAIPTPEGLTFHEARNRVIDDFEKSYAIALLRACGGVVTQAAKKAGVTRPTFHRWIKKHSIINLKP